ncbi:MAG: Holliday junction branch migration protein RuvA, partial [Planctomycetota bacterium]
MITTLEGTLTAVTENAAHVRVSTGITLEAQVPAFLCSDLASRLGATVTLHTRLTLDTTTQGASFTPRLVGFSSPRDRAFFELLTSVRGFGARKALRAMTMPCGEIAGAIASGDAALLQTLPEIGKKMATTIINELGEKALAFAP